MREHSHHCTLQSYKVPCVYTEQHKPHVTHAGISDQALNIRLRERYLRAIQNTNHREGQCDRRKLRRRLWKKGQRESDKPIGASLEQYSS